MKIRALIAAGAGLAAAAAPALAQDNSRFTPIQSNDRAYTCEQLMQEATVMTDEMGGSPNAVFGGEQALGLGTDLALRAGGAQVAGALGVFGGIARGAMEAQQKAAEERREMAQDRWYYLAGLYQGQNCDAPPPPPAPVAPAPAAPQPMAAEPVAEAAPEPLTMQPIPDPAPEGPQ